MDSFFEMLIEPKVVENPLLQGPEVAMLGFVLFAFAILSFLGVILLYMKYPRIALTSIALVLLILLGCAFHSSLFGYLSKFEGIAIPIGWMFCGLTFCFLPFFYKCVLGLGKYFGP